MVRILAFIFAFGFCQAWATQQNLVLVPGFFSSAVPAGIQSPSPWQPPYFSQDIVSYLRRSGQKVWVVDTLSPLAGIEENGERLISYLRAHEKELAGGPLLMIAHSAGGLYSLYAASHTSYPINRIITIGTPYLGLAFLKPLEEQNIPIDLFLKYFYLKNLLGLKPDVVSRFIQTLQLKRPVRVDAFAGRQSIGIDFWDWRTLSEALVPLQLLNNESSDGVVTVQSALGIGFFQGKVANLDAHVHTQVIGMEHWEFVLNAELARAFGVQNVGDLRNAQEWAYYNILKQAQ